MITVDYSTMMFDSQARTLQPEDLGSHIKSGWTIEGHIWEDWYEWVNEFKATHIIYGTIEGDFEKSVTCENQEALDHFLKYHPFYEWDYYDI